MNKALKLTLMAGVAMTLTSCHIYQKYTLPADQPIIEDYAKALEAPVDSSSLPYLSWREVFTDPLLQGYIQEALDNNKDLDNARKNVEIARAQMTGARLSYLPSIALAPSGGGAKFGDSDFSWTYNIPLSVNWEVDVFGKILNSKRGAEMGYQLSKDYEQAVQSQIICGVANTYYALVFLNEQLQLSRNTSVVWKEQVETMALMKEAAYVTEAAVVQSRANYFSILASITDIEKQITLTQNTLALLLNSYPAERPVGTNLEFELPVSLSKGVPMNYLASRPDVRAAEKKFAVAYYATNKARAAFYPSLNITPTGGFTNALGSLVVNPGKWFLNLAGSLTAPIFSRGQNITNLKVAQAQQEQALNDFRYSVLTAASDVSNALTQIEKNGEKREWVLQQVDQLEKSVEYTQELLAYGQCNYLELLTARVGLLSAQIASLTAMHDKATALITLYQVVGGGR